MDIIQKLDQRLGYKESMVISRDEFSDVENLQSYHGAVEEELERLEGVQKQLGMAREIIDGIIECIDDEGVVTPEDQKLLARRVVVALKFVSNL